MTLVISFFAGSAKRRAHTNHAQGLTATIYTAIYVAAFQPDTLHFILFLAIFPGSVAVMLSAFIHKVRAPQQACITLHSVRCPFMMC